MRSDGKGMRKQYYGFDVLKFLMALLVVTRHTIQYFWNGVEWARVFILKYLSNLAVPCFFMLAGFFLFKKIYATGHNNAFQSKESKEIVKDYTLHLFRLAVIWNLIYFPLDYVVYRDWGYPTAKAAIADYFRYAILAGNTVHMWYLPALIFACLLVYFAKRAGSKTRTILIAGVFLYCIGVIGDNWYYNQKMPQWFVRALEWYAGIFLTMRNGLFYGTVFVSFGLWLSENEDKIENRFAFLAFFVSMVCFYFEAKYARVTNMAFFSLPAAIFLTAFVCQFNGYKKNRFLLCLRKASEWIYLSHIWILQIIIKVIQIM